MSGWPRCCVTAVSSAIPCCASSWRASTSPSRLRAGAPGARPSGCSPPGIPGPELSAAKLGATNNLSAVSDFVCGVLGEELAADTGEWGTFNWTRFVLGVPGLRIAGGSDEVQRKIIGEQVLGLPR